MRNSNSKFVKYLIPYLVLIVISIFSDSCKKDNNSTNNTNNNPINDSVFVKFKVNSSNYTYIYPTDTIRATHNISGGIGYLSLAASIRNTSPEGVIFSFNTTNITVGSSHMLENLLSLDLPPGSYLVITPTMVQITECGNTGEYIRGNFTGQVQSNTPPNALKNIQGEFRVKRNF